MKAFARTQLPPMLAAVMAAAIFSVPQPDSAAPAGEAKTPSRTWPMFGGSLSRNMVNLADKNLPADWSVEEGKVKNIRWVADLGKKSFGSPVIADNKVFAGTNNARPRDPNVRGDHAVLMAFHAESGKFLWQNTHAYPAGDSFSSVRRLGLMSTVTYAEARLYYVAPTCEVLCADPADGKIHWRYDLMKQLDVAPCHGNICAPLVAGERVFVVTANGVDDKGKLRSPKAPSFVALHKTTGKLLWQSNLPGGNIIEGQWSSPTFAAVNGAGQVIFAGGDCTIYSFEPETGKLLWKCDCNPRRQKSGKRAIDNYIVSTPVVVGQRLYVGLGVYPEHPHQPRFSYFLCLDISRRGDVSLKSYDAGAPANKESALVWAFGGMIEPRPENGRDVYFASTMSTAAVHDGLVYISEERGYLHCLDAGTGKRYWDHDFQAAVWGSPYWVDGRVLIGADDGELSIFAHGRAKKLLTRINMEETMHTTPAAANGLLYVMSHSKLYAISVDK